jgi:hypothetical protein
MSFYDDASLVFLPSGQAGKDGKAYSMKPTDGSGDFTFSRGSNLTATRVDSNGLIEKGRENLLKQSNQFDTTWTTSNASVTSGQSGYDGSSDAWLLEATGTSSTRVQQTISTDSVQTISVYAKKGTADYFQIRLTGASTAFAFFNLDNGTLGTLSNQVDASITSVGSGWYRCSLTRIGAATSARIYVTGNNTTSVSVGDNIYIQDAQVEQGLIATEPIESGATTGLAGILEDSPRFDYSGGASCASLLLEGSRTNEIGYSEYFEGWTPQGSPTITTNYGTSPEGLQNSSRLVFTSVSDYIETSVTNTSGVFTLYAKGTGNLILTDSGANASSTTALTSSYQRIELYFSTNTTTLQIKTDSSGLDAEVYAAQFENATYATSYIPNHSGGSVTRDADINTLLNQSGVIGQTAGTILFDAYFDEADKVNFSISDSSVSNFISIETTSSNEVTAKVEQGGSTQATITTTTSFFAEGDRLKCAIAYDDRDMAFYINGTQVNTAAPNLIPACDDVRFGNYDGSIKADQRVNRVVLFTTRISNGNLATLTS